MRIDSWGRGHPISFFITRSITAVKAPPGQSRQSRSVAPFQQPDAGALEHHVHVQPEHRTGERGRRTSAGPLSGRRAGHSACAAHPCRPRQCALKTEMIRRRLAGGNVGLELVNAGTDMAHGWSSPPQARSGHRRRRLTADPAWTGAVVPQQAHRRDARRYLHPHLDHRDAGQLPRSQGRWSPGRAQPALDGGRAAFRPPSIARWRSRAPAGPARAAGITPNGRWCPGPGVTSPAGCRRLRCTPRRTRVCRPATRGTC